MEPAASELDQIVSDERGRDAGSGTLVEVEGMSRAAALRQLLIPLARHCIQPRFRHVHRHALGELLVWDNRSTAHRSSPQQRCVLP